MEDRRTGAVSGCFGALTDSRAKRRWRASSASRRSTHPSDTVESEPAHRQTCEVPRLRVSCIDGTSLFAGHRALVSRAHRTDYSGRIANPWMWIGLHHPPKRHGFQIQEGDYCTRSAGMYAIRLWIGTRRSGCCSAVNGTSTRAARVGAMMPP